MAMFLSTTVKAILLGLIAAAFGLSRLARAYPDVGWLQTFRLPTRQISEEERERRRKSGNRMAAVQMVLAGLILPFLYLASTVFMFENPSALAMIVVGAFSAACVAGGIWVFVRTL
jgi:hypothetical protein